MTVSGLGSARTPHSLVTPTNRPGRAVPPAATARNDFDHLTGADRELIFQATGQRVGKGFDPARESTTGFAAALAAERAGGRLAPGQEVTAIYLKDLNQRYERSGRPNPLAGFLDKAVEFLGRSGARRIDVSA
ncbi:MAG TPA: hypothetical protein VGB74_13840 [Actinoplanes sp.]